MTLSAPSFRASIGGTVLGFSPQGFLQLSVVLCWSQLSRLHLWYSAGLFPTGVFANFSGSLLVVVDAAQGFPTGVFPLLFQLYYFCVFSLADSFSVFDHVTVCNGCLYVRVTCVCTGLRAYVSVVQLQQTGVNRTYVASGLASNVT